MKGGRVPEDRLRHALSAKAVPEFFPAYPWTLAVRIPARWVMDSSHQPVIESPF